MNLLQRFLLFIKEEHLFQQTDTLLLAVSGGIDSVVLCELCSQLKYKFWLAHCNFQLRVDESSRDEMFVRNLASMYGVPIFVEKFETADYALSKKLSIQVAARELRYRYFYHILDMDKTSGDNVEKNFALPTTPRYLLTAHHGDDNVETMLMNLVKGTGISGLRAMLPKQGRLIRPLLFAHRTEIAQFATDHQLSFVEDSSNDSDKYTRNYFRHQLVPAVQKVFPGAEENLLNNMVRFRETEQLFMQAMALHKKKLITIKGTEVHIPVLKLKKSAPLQTIAYEIIKEYGFTSHQTSEVISLLDAESGKYVQSASYRIIKNRNWLIIAPIADRESQTILIEKNDKKITFGNGLLDTRQLAIEHCQLSSANTLAQLDADAITFPLILRKRKQSDYMYPLGMQKKKKLNRFLSDLKLSPVEKENIWLLEMDKKIIWIINYRIDDRFKITGKTRNVLQIKFTPGD